MTAIGQGGGKIRRETTIGHDTCLLGFSGRDSVDSAVFDTTTLSPGGVDEQQTVTITGTPTGGTFKLSFRGQQTAAIAYNAAASAVESALRALSRIGTTGVSVSGSAGGPYTVTFGGRWGGQDVDMLTAQPSLTGGTTPGVTVAESRKGSSKNKGLYVIESGLILTANAGGDKVHEFTAQGGEAIVGIFDGRHEFLDNSGTDDRPIAVYNNLCVFDKDKIQHFVTYQTALETWAAANACVFKSQGS